MIKKLDKNIFVHTHLFDKIQEDRRGLIDKKNQQPSKESH